jgi:hypothetical protein
MHHTTHIEPLSLEEVMFALMHEGQPAVAEMLVGRMRRAGLTTPALLATLRTAQHSLIARGLLDPGSETLCEPLRTLAQGMTGATASMGFRKPGAATYVYFGPSGTFEQTVEDGLRHTLREIDGSSSAVDDALEVFDIHDGADSECAAFDIPLSVFETIKRTPDTEVRRTLEDAGVPEDSAAAFAEDLTAPAFRGDVMHATHDADGRPRADGHALVLRGRSRTWLVRPSEQATADSLSVVPATPDAFRREMAALNQLT